MIHPPDRKIPQHNIKSETFLNPDKLYLPLVQHSGQPAKALVVAGDLVEEGGLLAAAGGSPSSPLHAPSRGKVTAIDSLAHPSLKRAQGIVLECLPQPKQYPLRHDVPSLRRQQLWEIIRDSGLVGMGGAGFPTHLKLELPQPIETLIINGCECEPYLACDYRLMTEKTKEIFAGIGIVSRLTEPKQIIFAVEDNKREVIKKINLAISTRKVNLANIRLKILRTAYPQGAERQLIQSVTGREVAAGRLPREAGCLVHNVATCFAIYEAVYLGKPLIERLVSFAGDALVEPKNIWVKIGTSLRELVDKKIFVFRDEPRKIICGGPLMGLALAGLDYPVLKTTGGFLFLKKEVADYPEQPCLKCARCCDACPMRLLPLEQAKRVKREEFDALEGFNISDCIECGSCAYVCPARIPLVHYIRIGKQYSSQTK